MLKKIYYSMGVEKEDVTLIYSAGRLKINPETDEFELYPEIALGKLIVTGVDEMVAEDSVTFSGRYNRINVYDHVFFARTKEEESEKQ